MSTLILGASAGVGRALCRAFAAGGHDLVILARDAADLEAEASHCRLIYGVKVDCVVVDGSDLQHLHDVFTQHPIVSSRVFRNILFPIGASTTGDNGLTGVTETSRLVQTNLTGVIVAIGALLPKMVAAGGGNVIGFGSVAAIRGRSSNVVYAAAKRALESYFESIRHATAFSGVKVHFYRLGYVSTQLSYGKRLLFPPISPAQVASRVYAQLDADIGLKAIPAYWQLIGILVRALPWKLFRRMNF